MSRDVELMMGPALSQEPLSHPAHLNPAVLTCGCAGPLWAEEVVRAVDQAQTEASSPALPSSGRVELAQTTIGSSLGPGSGGGSGHRTRRSQAPGGSRQGQLRREEGTQARQKARGKAGVRSGWALGEGPPEVP